MEENEESKAFGTMIGNDLSGLKVGDYVYFCDRMNRYHVVKVEKITPKQIVTRNSRYRKDDGRLIGGDDWSVHYIYPLTEDIKRLYLRQRMTAKVSKADFGSLCYEPLKEIYDILEKYNGAVYDRELWNFKANNIDDGK